MKIFFTLLLVASCSTFNKEPEIAAWTNRPIDETSTHPYFRTLELTKSLNADGTSLWTYRDNTAGNGQGHCATLGGCRSMAMLYCEYHFKVEEEKIVELNHSGVCPMSRKVLAPKKP